MDAVVDAATALHHFAKLDRNGFDDEMVAIRRGTVDFDPKLASLLALAREYTKDVGSVQDAAWRSALYTGWNIEQLTELSVHVTLNLFTNYVNHFVQTDLDLPALPAL